MALNDFYKASAIFSHPNASGELVITFHFELTDITTGLTETGFCNELASQLRLIVETDYIPYISDDYTFIRVDTFNVSQPQYNGTYPSGTAGGQTGAETVSLRSAPVIARKSGLRGRRLNGRMFLLAPSEGDQSNGVLSTSIKGYLKTFADNTLLVTTGNSNDYTQVVYSGLNLDGVQVFTMLVRDVLGSQRGRQKTA